ncbi:methyltransferase domain-containing protein [Candidatus Poribacteria bacterium]|nr:methyltransferase domain-containing protein [Candidatus Poribacteria bacterium]
MYIYITPRSEQEKHITEAECMAIIGEKPDENGLVISDFEADISGAAYIKTAMRIIFHAASLDELYKKLEDSDLSSDGFRVSVLKIPRSLKYSSRDIMHNTGARIAGKPHLNNPKTVFLVLITKEDIRLGEVTSKAIGDWNQHSQKAHLYSSALPTRLARGMINLVAKSGDRIIDPCCGSGTILVEALSAGMKAAGCDINPKMAEASIENLRHFGMDCMVLVADARDIKGSFDAVVTDLPYGRNCMLDDQLYLDILTNLKNLAPRISLVVHEDISQMLGKIGYKVKKVIPVPKTSLVRYIHLA